MTTHEIEDLDTFRSRVQSFIEQPLEHRIRSISLRGGDTDEEVQLGFIIASAEMVGAMQAAFDMTVEWAFDSYSFGRPLASYEALKHRFADMKSWLDMGDPDAAELASAAMVFVADYRSELLQECGQMHGGIGLTYGHDLHFLLRRKHAQSRIAWKLGSASAASRIVFHVMTSVSVERP